MSCCAAADDTAVCMTASQDILGHMLEFSLDQLGSRFIQQKLDTLTPEELEAAFAEVAPKGVMLMNDVFGNYVIQKFLELEAGGPRQELAQQMKGQVRNTRLLQQCQGSLCCEQLMSLCSNPVEICVRDPGSS